MKHNLKCKTVKHLEKIYRRKSVEPRTWQRHDTKRMIHKRKKKWNNHVIVIINQFVTINKKKAKGEMVHAH